jgi:hypothetical protein
MVKVEKILGLLVRGNATELSILESRKHNQAGTSALSGGLHSQSTPKRMGQCRKAGLFTRGLRKSSSLTNGMIWSETKIRSESMALRPEVYICPATLSMRPSWALR